MKIRRRLTSIILLIAGCMVAVGLAEGVVRLVDPHARDHVIPGGFFISDATLGWRLRPGTTVTHRSRYFTVAYATNVLGYRDRPRTMDKKTDRTRMLMYGDSQVFGWGVPESQRFSDFLEAERLNLVKFWQVPSASGVFFHFTSSRTAWVPPYFKRKM